MNDIKSKWPLLLIVVPAAFAVVSFINMQEAMFEAGCKMGVTDDQSRLLCKKLARAFSWGFKSDVAWGDETWRFDSDLYRYIPDGVKVDKTKYLQ